MTEETNNYTSLTLKDLYPYCDDEIDFKKVKHLYGMNKISQKKYNICCILKTLEDVSNTAEAVLEEQRKLKNVIDRFNYTSHNIQEQQELYDIDLNTLKRTSIISFYNSLDKINDIQLELEALQSNVLHLDKDFSQLLEDIEE